ncbi:response regulator [Williamwhitmania taraxaci]|uniref:Response regulator receiver protein n=1 Tax=Williamwhitmania taraxaci TaxID=1640674 RepID=A0A1G6GNL6_9BACT|nr:response regulator [Williamwhitmania taraxaci]SDB83590.1 response regulator receiver protein [Williamwhitmania taraxaci]
MDTRKILIAEDEEANFLYLKEVLEEFHLGIVWAKNGREAVEFTRLHKPIILLLDIKMPIMNGLEALQIIKAEFPDMPVIAQTAYAMDEERIKCLEAGCDDYLAKPILPDQIIEMVSKYLKP